MSNMRQLCAAASGKMLLLDRKKWCRAFFQTSSKSGSPDNNIAETFNSWILRARCKPIISMNEEIMDMLIARFREKKLSLAKWDGDVAPRIRKKLNDRIEMARNCRVIWNGEQSFRVRDGRTDRVDVVDWIDGTCTCGYWQLSGVPCEHVVVCADDRNRSVNDFVNVYYKKEKYLATYGTAMECTQGREMWDEYEGEKPEPPQMRSRPGRPRNKRRKPKEGEIKKKKVRGATVQVLTSHGRKKTLFYMWSRRAHKKNMQE